PSARLVQSAHWQRPSYPLLEMLVAHSRPAEALKQVSKPPKASLHFTAFERCSLFRARSADLSPVVATLSPSLSGPRPVRAAPRHPTRSRTRPASVFAPERGGTRSPPALSLEL